MGKRKKSEFFEASQGNVYTYMQYYNRLVELAISAFKWNNLPESVDERFLELSLFMDGHAVFFHDDDLSKTALPDDSSGYLALRCAYNGSWDVYNRPTKTRAYASNGYNKPLDNNNSVIIYNNRLRTNSVLDVEQFAKRLYNIDRIIDVNVNAQKTPILVACPENKRLSLKNVYMQYDGNYPVIYGTDDLQPDMIKAMQTGAPYVADRLYELKTKIWNEALTYLGITNLNINKKERLVKDEVDRSMGGVMASRFSRLEARHKACQEINKMFGLDLWVEYRDGYSEDEEDAYEFMPKGSEEDGVKEEKEDE